MAAIAAIAPLITAGVGLASAFSKPPSQNVYTPPAYQEVDLPTAPTLATPTLASDVTDAASIKKEQQRKAALLASSSNVTLNSSTTRFAPVKPTNSTNTLLGE